MKTICEQERASKRWKLNVHSYRRISLAHLWFHQPPGGRGVSGAGTGRYQARLLTLENEVKKLGEEGARYVGNWTP